MNTISYTAAPGCKITGLTEEIFKQKIEMQIAERFIIESDKAEKIFKVILHWHGLEEDQAISSSRKSDVVKVRQRAMYFMKKHTTLSLFKIGNIVGRKSHVTVKWGINAVNNLMETSKFYRTEMEELTQLINSALAN